MGEPVSAELQYAPTRDLILFARGLASGAHAGQTDKAGRPYIDHVRRVARGLGPQGMVVGWLHDIVEDPPVTLDALAVTFPTWVVAAVDAVTHRDNEPRSVYYERVKANALAHAVKVADVLDNSNPHRLGRLDVATADRLVAKYEAALDALEVTR